MRGCCHRRRPVGVPLVTSTCCWRILHQPAANLMGHGLPSRDARSMCTHVRAHAAAPAPLCRPHSGYPYSPAAGYGSAGYQQGGYYAAGGAYYPAQPPGFAGYATPYAGYGYTPIYGPIDPAAAYTSASRHPPPPPGQPASSGTASQQPPPPPGQPANSGSRSRRHPTGSTTSPPPAPGGSKRAQNQGASKAASGSPQRQPQPAETAAAGDDAAPAEPQSPGRSAATAAAVDAAQPEAATEAATEDAAVEAAADHLQRAAVLSEGGEPAAAAEAAVPATPAPIAEPAAAPSAPASSEAAPMAAAAGAHGAAAAAAAAEERRECAICLDDEPAAVSGLKLVVEAPGCGARPLPLSSSAACALPPARCHWCAPAHPTGLATFCC